jgi:hypothetical protein
MWVGNVADQADNPPPGQFGDSGSRSFKHIGSAAGQYHFCPRPRQGLTDCGSETARATSHDGNSAI